MSDHTPRPWEPGGSADASRTPGTRRLWLAGALALTVATACVTALAVTDRTPRTDIPARASGDPTADGPGLLSFASPSESATAAAPKGGSGLSPVSAQDASSPSGAPKPAPATSPAGPAGPPRTKQPEPAPRESGTSVRSVNYPDRYWHISGDLVRLDPLASPADRTGATFTVVNGLARSGCYSFATADGGYLRHRNFLLRAEPDDGTRLFRQDATFCPRPSPYPGATMLESVNFPGRFLRHQNFQLRLDPYQGTGLYQADAAFELVTGVG